MKQCQVNFNMRIIRRTRQGCRICGSVVALLPGIFFNRHFYTIYAIFTRFYAIFAIFTRFLARHKNSAARHLKLFCTPVTRALPEAIWSRLESAYFLLRNSLYRLYNVTVRGTKFTCAVCTIPLINMKWWQLYQVLSFDSLYNMGITT